MEVTRNPDPGTFPGSRALAVFLSSLPPAQRREVARELLQLGDLRSGVAPIPNPFALIDNGAHPDDVAHILRSMMFHAAGPLIGPPVVGGDEESVVESPVDLGPQPVGPPSDSSAFPVPFTVPGSGDPGSLSTYRDSGVLSAEAPELLAVAFLRRTAPHDPVAAFDELNGIFNFSGELAGGPLEGGLLDIVKKVGKTVSTLAKSPIGKVVKNVVKAVPVLGTAVTALDFANDMGLFDKLTGTKKPASSAPSPSASVPTPEVPPSTLNNVVTPKTQLPTPNPDPSLDYIDSLRRRKRDDLTATEWRVLLKHDLGPERYRDVMRHAVEESVATGDLLTGGILSGVKKISSKVLPKIKSGGKKIWGKVSGAAGTPVGQIVGTTGAYYGADYAIGKIMDEDPEGAVQDAEFQIDTDGDGIADAYYQEGAYSGPGYSWVSGKAGLAAPASGIDLQYLRDEGNSMYMDWRNAFLSVNPLYLVGDVGATSQDARAVTLITHGLPLAYLTLIPSSCVAEVQELLADGVSISPPHLTRRIIGGLLTYAAKGDGSIPLSKKTSTGWVPAASGMKKSSLVYGARAKSGYPAAPPIIGSNLKRRKQSTLPLSLGDIDEVVQGRGHLLEGGLPVVVPKPGLPAPIYKPKPLLTRPAAATSVATSAKPGRAARLKKRLAAAAKNKWVRRGAVAAGAGGAIYGGAQLLSSDEDGNLVEPNPLVLDILDRELSDDQAARLGEGPLLLLPYFLGDVIDEPIYALDDHLGHLPAVTLVLDGDVVTALL